MLQALHFSALRLEHILNPHDRNQHGADGEDELVTIYAGEPAAFMAGRLEELAAFNRASLDKLWARSFMTLPE